jgi:hypothetical protein
MKEKDARFTVRIQEERAKKLEYIADYYQRNMNGQIYWLVKQEVEAFEREHGAITPEDLEEYYAGKE